MHFVNASLTPDTVPDAITSEEDEVILAASVDAFDIWDGGHSLLFRARVCVVFILEVA